MSRRSYTRLFLIAIAAMAVLMPVARTSAAADGRVKVFILAGQSNMEGKAKVSLLEHLLSQPGTREQFQHLKKGGKWIVRDDVWIKFLNRKGNLTVGYGSPGRIGPELEFGIAVGDRYDRQVLIIKIAWGGKSLYRDFRPPSSGDPPAEHLERELARYKKRKPATTMEEVKARYGMFYRKMLEEVSDTLDNLKDHFPDYKGQGYEISGFVWFQGWNDMVNAEYTAAYTENMVNFIRDVRKDLKTPNLPFVIGVLGVGGVEEKPNPKKQRFKDAQAAAGELPEFKGNVKVVKTDVFWDMTADAVYKKGWRKHFEEWEKVGSDYSFHYYGSVKTFSQIGAAFGKAIIELCEQRK